MFPEKLVNNNTISTYFFISEIYARRDYDGCGAM